MKLPLYKEVDLPANLGVDAHRGLRFEKFFNYYNDQTWEVMKEKTQWLEEIAKSPAGNPSTLTDYYHRRCALVKKLQGKSAIFVTQWHFATGLGLPHPIENGFAWHPTLGTPYLAGSAVKGLMRAWLEIWEENEQTQGKKLRWLGSEDDKNPQAGELICFDAIPIAPVKLIVDVMTPHYGKWYEQGGEITDYKAAPERLPADWHEPIPVVFLAVDQRTSFLFSIAPRRPPQLPDSDLDEALGVLAKALEWLGAGAKTAVGYGHWQRDETKTQELEAEYQRRRKTEQLVIMAKARKERLSPLELRLEKLIAEGSRSGMADYLCLLKEFQTDQWQTPTEKTTVLQFIKERMVKAKVWKETTQAKKPEKDKDYQRTRDVLNYMNQPKDDGKQT